MFIPPKRRRRIMRAHHLRQQGHSLRQISEKLSVSLATVRADLKLAQTHWGPIAAASADDLLLESLHLLRSDSPARSSATYVSQQRQAASRRSNTSAPATPGRPSSTASPERSAAPSNRSTSEPNNDPTNPTSSTKNRKNCQKPSRNQHKLNPPIPRSPVQSRRSSNLSPQKKKSPHNPTGHPSNSPAQPATEPNPPKSTPTPPANSPTSALLPPPMPRAPTRGPVGDLPKQPWRPPPRRHNSNGYDPSLLLASIHILKCLGVIDDIEAAGFTARYGANMVWGLDPGCWTLFGRGKGSVLCLELDNEYALCSSMNRDPLRTTSVLMILTMVRVDYSLIAHTRGREMTLRHSNRPVSRLALNQGNVIPVVGPSTCPSSFLPGTK